MNNEDLIKKLEEILGIELIKELRAQIEKIENSIPTTKDHYGDYMGALSRFEKNKLAMGNMFIILGANKEGIANALRFV